MKDLSDDLDVLFDACFADAKEYIENDEDTNINEQLHKEMDTYYSDDLAYLNREDLKKKLKKFNKLEFNSNDVNQLKKLATQKYGFINNTIRKKAWPLLILNREDQLSSVTATALRDNFDYTISPRKIREHRYNKQVELDVVRTLKRFPPQISDDLREKLQEKLINIICSVLIVNDKDNLNYYQGYHDICLTFLLVTGVNNCIPMISQITQTHFKDFMERTMEKTIQILFNIMPLIDKLNGNVAEHIVKAELDVAFALSWLITWYSHVIDDLKIILRLYDFFIATDPLMPIYLGAVIVCENSNEILQTECDMASLYSLITKFPQQYLEDMDTVEMLIKKSISLYALHPPDTLPKLIEQWKDKSKRVQIEYQQANQMENLRYRGGVRSGSRRVEDESTKAITRRKLNAKTSVNKFLMGVLSIGVAATAVYVLTTNPKEPEDIFMKFYHLLAYR